MASIIDEDDEEVELVTGEIVYIRRPQIGDMMQLQCSRCESFSVFALAGSGLLGYSNYIYTSGPEIGNRLDERNFHQGQYVCNVCLANPGKQ